MDAVLRSAAVYLALLILFRMTGKRTLAQVTSFDFVLLLIVAEGTQQALLGDDFSVTNGILVVVTLVALDRFADWLGARSERIDVLLDGRALILIEDGHVHHERMRRTQVDMADILEYARTSQGLERPEQIKHAVLERNGGISIIPRQSA